MWGVLCREKFEVRVRNPYQLGLKGYEEIFKRRHLFEWFGQVLNFSRILYHIYQC